MIVGIRPESVSIAAGADERLRLPARVARVEPLGGETIVHAQVFAPAVVTDEFREVMRDVDETALEQFEQADENRFAVVLPSRDTPRAGADVELALDPAALSFFDPADGRALR